MKKNKKNTVDTVDSLGSELKCTWDKYYPALPDYEKKKKKITVDFREKLMVKVYNSLGLELKCN